MNTLSLRERVYASRLSGWRLVSRVSNPASSLMESPSATLWAISPRMAKTSPSFLSNVLVQRLASVRLWTSFDDHTKLTGGLPDATGDDGFDLKRLADGPGIVCSLNR